MSWSTWTTATGPPIPSVVAGPPISSTLLPTALNPAPNVLPPNMQYNHEQWAQAQQQNWQQWAQWQQQYQQWHQQYGAEYQKSLNALQNAPPAVVQPTVQPPLPVHSMAVAPPLPMDNKPPLPPEEPPVNQANIASYSTTIQKPIQTGYNTAPPSLMTQQPPADPYGRHNWGQAQKRPAPRGNAFEGAKKPTLDRDTTGAWQQFSQPPPQVVAPPKPVVEELSEAEKKFDKEFAAWEAQFNKWKDQNVNHPDKTQYREYEKKWESWRNSLLERREQMRRKRIAMSNQALTGAEAGKFSQRPPPLGSKPSLLGPGPQLGAKESDNFFSKPPPNQNNEPLSFGKAPSAFPAAEVAETVGAGFLQSNACTAGGIPGLDLVENDDKSEDERDKEDREQKAQEQESQASKGPDLDAISKGINSILGDQKLLSMLSMVSQTAPPPKQAFKPQDHVYNDYSNQSYDDRSNHEDYHPHQPREAVNNFDDQTRSSFTMGPNDDQGMRGRGFGGQPDTYGPPPDRFSGPPPHEDRNNFGGARMEHYRGPPPQDNEGFGMGNSRNAPDNNRSNFGPGGQRNNPRGFGRGSFNDGFDDNYRRDEFQNFNMGGGENYGRQGEQFNRNSFDDNRFGNRFGGHDAGNYNEDYDNQEDDYEDYHRRFNEDEDQYQKDRYEDDMRGRPPPHVRSNIPSLMDRVAPAPPQICGHPSSVNAPMNMETAPQPAPVEEEFLFEPVQLIDYEHKPLTPPEPDVAVEPLKMFDYHHKPLNQIMLMERPQWLVQEFKFIREFDYLPPRYEKPVERFRGVRDLDFGSRDRDYGHRERELVGRSRERDRGREFDYKDVGTRGERYGRERERDYEYGRRGRDDFDDRAARYDRNKYSRGRSQEDTRTKSENMKLNKLEFEDLSDDDMDWEQGEQKRHKRHEDKRRSRSKSPQLSNPPNPTNSAAEITMIEEIINPPGRTNRPPRIVIILRGPPGSGKTFLARLIKDKEIENGGSAPRILSLDDYFMVEHEKRVLEDGKVQTIKEMVYEYEPEMEDSYRISFLKSFKKTITDGYFPFVIVDTVNDKVKHFGEMWSFAKQNGFQVYICQLDLDPVQCTKRNIHNRTEAEIEECISGWEPTPSHHPTIDVSGLLQTPGIPDVEMEVEDDLHDNKSARDEQGEDFASQGRDHVRSKWDTFDCSSNNLAKLDGVGKPLRKERTMEEFLQLEDEWEPIRPSKSGKKRVRWADLEEQREQEKMRKIGFVVGHTNWGRMMDPTGGSSALTKTKYI